MKYIDKEIVNNYKEASVYISKAKSNLLLEIITPQGTKDIYFISEINGYKFESIPEAMNYLNLKLNR